MDLLTSQGFSHIGLQIFKNLDDQSLCKCRLVCSKWYVFITREKFWRQRIIQRALSIEYFKSDEWRDIFDDFREEEDKLCEIINEFFVYIHENQDSADLEECNYPYYVPVMTQNLEHISYMWPYLSFKNDVYCLAAERGCAEVVKFMIAEIEDKNPVAHEGLTLLHCAANNGHFKVVQNILDKILDKNPKSEDGRTPLHFAAGKGHLLIVRLILDSVAEKNPATNTGCTPLHLSADSGHLDIVQSILDSTMDKNPRDQNGQTPLHLAAGNGHVQVVQCLMDNIADKYPRDRRKRTPLWYATKYAHTNVIKCFRA